MGNTAPCGAAFVTRLRALVCETDADLQRCARLGSARTVDLADFRVLAGSPEYLESPDRPARPPHGRCLQASLNCKVKLSGSSGNSAGYNGRLCLEVSHGGRHSTPRTER